MGRTGLKVSRLIFGGTHLGEIVNAEKARVLVDQAWALGINTFYTADKYNNGAGEEYLGAALGKRRDDAIVLIKSGFRVGTREWPDSPAERLATRGLGGTIDDGEMWAHGVTPNARGLSRKHLLQAVEASLRRLGTDYIDIYVMHFWDPFTPVEETLGALSDLVGQGKVRYIGCSQTRAWQLYRGLWVSELKGLPRFESVQVRFNLFELDATEELIPAAHAAGVSVLAFQSLAGNVLRGDFTYGEDVPTGLGYRKIYTDMYWSERSFDFVERLKALSQELGRAPGEVAQAWALAQPAVTALQIGPNEPEEFAAQVRAADHPLERDELEAVENLLVGDPR